MKRVKTEKVSEKQGYGPDGKNKSRTDEDIKSR